MSEQKIELQTSNSLPLALALVHHPVCNKNGETIGSAVTNLDIHDIARAGRTFGIERYYLVTPYSDQQQLVRDIVGHWLTGHGATYNTKRKDALSLVRLCSDLGQLYEEASAHFNQRPTILATSAKASGKQMSYEDVRGDLLSGKPYLVLLGTAWGMAPEVFEDVDGFLPPILGRGKYNHLSVRSAAAIMLDRLCSIG